MSWPVVVMPSEPAPKSIEPTIKNIAGASMNPFTGQQQIYDWQSSYMVLKISMPPMDPTTGAVWIAFLESCKGIVSVFQIANTTFAAQIPAGAWNNGYWRMNSNDQTWSVNEGLVVGMSFEIRTAF